MQMPKYEAYKYSGYEWIGDIPENWELTKLGRTLKPVSIKNKPELPLLSITREQGIILRDIENLEVNHNFIPDDLSGYKILGKGQFGMNKMKAWQGSYGVSDYTGIVSPAYYVFNFMEPIFPDFFHKAIRSKLYVSFFGCASDGVRIGQWDLSKSRMKDIPFLVPPIEEQTAIAAFLDRKTAQIDQTVAIKEKQIVLLKERKQILIENAVTRGLDPNVPMKNSGVERIGEIPAHWEISRVKWHGKIASGESITNSKLTDKGSYEVFGGNGLMGYTEKFNISGQKIIIGRVGAYCGNVRYSDEERWISDNALVLTLSLNENYEFFTVVLTSAKLNELNESNAQPLITGTKVMNLYVAMPPNNERLDIVEFVKSESDKIDAATNLQQQQIHKLKEYKTTLINSAVTGKIKVA